MFFLIWPDLKLPPINLWSIGQMNRTDAQEVLKSQQEELEFLRWVWSNPVISPLIMNTIKETLKNSYELDTGKQIPEKYR